MESWKPEQITAKDIKDRYLYSGIICDGCSLTLEWYGILTKRRVLAHAREKGWMIGKQALCPRCRRK